MGKKRQLLARSRLEKDVFSSYVALQSARSLPPAPNSLSLRGWFFDDVDPPRRLKGDYYTCSNRATSDKGVHREAKSIVMMEGTNKTILPVEGLGSSILARTRQPIALVAARITAYPLLVLN